MHAPPVDWMETARRVAGLDLIISVDTSMVHLAGAMGIPCWCALHCRPYFVFPLVREDCPWYPSVQLFKQSKEFEWQPVFERIAKELHEYTRHHSV
jgi:ADP-heptose:LPS heptosyltransferase